MAGLIILRKAHRDISRACSYLEEQQRGLGYRFFKNLKQCIRAAANNPGRYAVAYDGYHEGIESTFHYIFYYSEVGETIVVHAVVHASRDQEAILKSLP